MRDSVVLLHFQINSIIEAKEANRKTIQISPDLGLTVIEISVVTDGAIFPGNNILNWDGIMQIKSCSNNCFELHGGKLTKIITYSQLTGLTYSLMSTNGAPTMLISGIPMHRIKGIDPYQDTLEKLRTLKHVGGNILDTATGLGYTAIEASKTAEHVTSIELDPAAIEIARINPWSRSLFDNPKITQLIGDSFDVIHTLKAGDFTRVIHDPPTFTLAGDLYSTEFYRELYRVLRQHGMLFHYIGNPESKSGQNVTRGVTRRLKDAGFLEVIPKPSAFGVVAYK